MVAVTYGVARVPASPGAAAANAASVGRSAFARFFNAMLEARLRAAEREIARYSHLLDGKVDADGNSLEKQNGH